MTITHNFEPEQQYKKFPKITLVVVLGLISLGILEIWVSHTLATYGEKFEEIEKLQKIYLMENSTLENKIAQDSSLSSIASQSATLGLIKPKDIQYIR